jgi:hypothetical protein
LKHDRHFVNDALVFQPILRKKSNKVGVDNESLELSSLDLDGKEDAKGSKEVDAGGDDTKEGKKTWKGRQYTGRPKKMHNISTLHQQLIHNVITSSK